MDRRAGVTVGLAVLGVALLVVAFVATPEPRLRHNAQISLNDSVNYSERSYLVVHYDNLSQRGKTVYRKALANGGQYTVEPGAGVPEFTYRPPASGSPGENLTEELRRRTVVVVRPNDSSLPPAMESLGDDGHDAMVTVRTEPDVVSPAYVLPLASLVAGLASLVGSAYLRFAKPDIEFLDA